MEIWLVARTPHRAVRTHAVVRTFPNFGAFRTSPARRFREEQPRRDEQRLFQHHVAKGLRVNAYTFSDGHDLYALSHLYFCH